ncbi:MAG: hypothetical protein ACOCNS_00290 [Bacteroidales bacterium]
MGKIATWSVALISRIFAQASAIELAHIAECSRKSQSKFSRKRAQSRIYSGYAERSRKSQSKYVELVKIRATYKVAII